MSVVKKRSNLGKLRDKLTTLDSKQDFTDARMWKLGKDKAGNGMAIIRFLPEINDEDLPVVKYFSHWFKNEENGRYFKENCPTSPTSTDKRCPVCESNRTLFNGTEKEKELASKRKRKLHYLANILVIEDPVNPQNNGKVFLYDFGMTIYNRIQDKISPKFESEEAWNPVCLFEGAAFKLKGSKKTEKGKNEEYTYEASEWLPREDISEMEGIDEILAQRHDLMSLVDSSIFKSYEELSETLDKCLNGKVYESKDKLKSKETADEEAEDDDTKALQKALDAKRKKKEESEAKAKKEKVVDEEDSESENDDDDDDYIKKLEALSRS